jgi:CheY-like chemotaxis protein
MTESNATTTMTNSAPRAEWPKGFPSPRADDPKGRALHVLVVDDDDTTGSTSLLLRSCGHKVRTAADGRAALRAALADPPDVVLLDLGLPGMSGYEVARRLRAWGGARQPFLIAITGFGNAMRCADARESGIDLWLLKPTDPEQLLQLLQRLRKLLVLPEG